MSSPSAYVAQVSPTVNSDMFENKKVVQEPMHLLKLEDIVRPPQPKADSTKSALELSNSESRDRDASTKDSHSHKPQQKLMSEDSKVSPRKKVEFTSGTPI